MRLRRTTKLTICLMGVLVGVVLSRRLPQLWLLAGVSGICLLGLRKLWPGLMLLSLALGSYRGLLIYKQTQLYRQFYGQTVTVQGIAQTDGVYAESGGLGFDMAHIEIRTPVRLHLPGGLKIETLGVPAIFRGDKVELRGKLYPAGGARQGSLKFAQGKALTRQLNWLEHLRLRFNASLQSILPEPQASFGLGVLVGQRSTLPKETTKQLAAVGLTHIIAVSGYNLTIIIRFLGKGGAKSKYQTLIVSTVMISLFVLITGFSASIVRAAIVSMLSLVAWYYGRAIKPVLLLVLSAAITVLWNPIYIWSDIGWYLSFLAFFGVLVLSPLVTQHFLGHQAEGVKALIIETSSAQIMTVPLVMYIFGETSLVALPANMFIVPLVPPVMLLTALAGTVGLVFPVLAAWLAWPARILLAYMLEVVSVMARLPHAVWHQTMAWPFMTLAYCCIALACWHFGVKIKRRSANITDEGD